MNNQNFNVPEQGFNHSSGSMPLQSLDQNFTAPAVDSRERRSDISLIEPGFHPAIIWAVVQLGTISDRFGEGNKVFIGFEFAHIKQLFYMEDTEPRSTILSKECSSLIGDRSFLKKLYDAVYRRTLSIEEAKEVKWFDLVGKVVGVNVSHKISQKGETYERIDSCAPFNYTIPENFIPEMEKQFFYINSDYSSFRSLNFAKLPGWIAKKVKSSNEAMDYASKGGVFAELPKERQEPQQNVAQQQVPQQPQQQVSQQPQQFQQQVPQQPQQQPQQQVPQQPQQQGQFNQPNFNADPFSGKAPF